MGDSEPAHEVGTFSSSVIGRKHDVYICTPMCASARIGSSNIVYLSTDIDPRGEVC